MGSFWKWYHDCFNVDEIRSSRRLIILFYAVAALSIFDLTQVSFTSLSVYGNDTCWAFFPNCTEVFPLPNLPEGYFYTGLMGFLLFMHVAAIVLAYHSNWTQAHFILTLILLWKFSFHFILRDTGKQNFEYFMLLPAFVFLFSKNKLNSSRWIWATLYFFAASVKFHEAWIAGTYFSSMRLGLPLVSSKLTPVVSQLAIIFEIAFSYGLIAKNVKYRALSFYLWVGFHLYSVFLVGYFYPVRCLVYLFILFYPIKDAEMLPASALRSQPLFLAFLTLLYVLHIIPMTSKRDIRFTFEGLGAGFFMFDSNHQCFIQYKLFDQNENIIVSNVQSLIEPRSRCSPWHVLQKIHRLCLNKKPSRAEYIHDHSINGGPIYRMVHESDACNLKYKFWGNNQWIKDISENPKIVGYPYFNQIGDKNLRDIIRWSPTPQIPVTSYQKFILENIRVFKLIFISAWFLVIGLGLYRIFFAPK